MSMCIMLSTGTVYSYSMLRASYGALLRRTATAHCTGNGTGALVRRTGTAHWYGALVRRTGTAHWYGALVRRTGTAHWYGALVRRTGTAHWYGALVRRTGTAHWYGALVRRTGTAHWYGALVRRTGTGKSSSRNTEADICDFYYILWYHLLYLICIYTTCPDHLDSMNVECPLSLHLDQKLCGNKLP